MNTKLMAYLADYINEEIERGATIDKYTIAEAVASFDGGAADDVVVNDEKQFTVYAVQEVVYETTVKAHCEQKAWEIAFEDDGLDWKEVTVQDWSIVEVKEQEGLQ